MPEINNLEILFLPDSHPNQMDIFILDIVKPWDLTLCKLKFQMENAI
jgi:hypothetical protein